MSIELCIALLITVPLFWLVPARWRHGFLALASVAYLFWVDSEKTRASWSVAILAGYGALFWALTPWLALRVRWVEITAFVLAPAFLLYFKYLPPILHTFLSSSTATVFLPLGISYYTFKLLHYLFEVQRGAISERSLAKFLCYLYLFPTFSAGPIERYDHFLANLEPGWDRASSVEGARRIVFGLIKRFVLARYLNGFINGHGVTEANLLDRLPQVSTPWLWAYFLLYYLYVYLDFSAYSDIAIGASRLFGIRILENFRFPLVACDIREYWRRWHMTLSGWCQSYIYMPVIGATRRPHAALFLTFLVMGLWHEGSWNRVGWGMYHTLGVAAFTAWNRFHKSKRWSFMTGKAHTALAWGVTHLFVAGSMCFLIQSPGHGLWQSVRLLLKLVGLDVQG
jgi:alginate O-acetyltransferase complex protein AlgI